MAKKNKRYNDPPTPPADAAGYTLVRTKERVYWRRKRGTIKKATLNSSFKKNAEIMAMASPAAKRILDKLDPYLHGLETGRFIANVSARLKKAFKESGEMGFSLMKNYELQPWYPLHNLLRAGYTVTQKNNELVIQIPIFKGTLQRLNKSVSDYYFEAILLWGDVQKTRGLRVESETSPLYNFNQPTKTVCKMQLNLPTQKAPWMLLLKLSCLEGNKTAHASRNYGMKVVEMGRS